LDALRVAKPYILGRRNTEKHRKRNHKIDHLEAPITLASKGYLAANQSSSCMYLSGTCRVIPVFSVTQNRLLPRFVWSFVITGYRCQKQYILDIK
jgi:hypothetical protein